MLAPTAHLFCDALTVVHPVTPPAKYPEILIALPQNLFSAAGRLKFYFRYLSKNSKTSIQFSLVMKSLSLWLRSG